MDIKNLIHFVGGARTSGGFALSFSVSPTTDSAWKNELNHERSISFSLSFLYLPLTKSLMASTFAQEIRWRRPNFLRRAAARTAKRRLRWHWCIKEATIGLACEKRHTRRRCVFAKFQIRANHFLCDRFCGEGRWPKIALQTSLASLVTGCVRWIDSNFTLSGTWNMNWKSSRAKQDMPAE